MYNVAIVTAGCKARALSLSPNLVNCNAERQSRYDPVSLRTARIAGQIAARCRARGKVVPTVDLYIGATAIELGFRVVTANLRHFKLIPRLKIVRFV